MRARPPGCSCSSATPALPRSTTPATAQVTGCRPWLASQECRRPPVNGGSGSDGASAESLNGPVDICCLPKHQSYQMQHSNGDHWVDAITREILTVSVRSATQAPWSRGAASIVQHENRARATDGRQPAPAPAATYRPRQISTLMALLSGSAFFSSAAEIQEGQIRQSRLARRGSSMS